MVSKQNINQNLLSSQREQSLLINKQSSILSHYIKAATSDNTRKAYRSAIRQFEKWGGRLPTNQETITRYIVDRAEKLNSRTLALHLTALSQWHNSQGLTNPVSTPLVRKTMDGIRRIHGKPKRKAKALRLEHLTIMLNYLYQLPETKKKRRDIALLLMNFFGAFRRSELVSIQVSDLRWEPEGLIVQLKRSKTDQDGEGQLRALPYGDKTVCAATALKIWLKVAKIKNGPAFRAVNRWDQINIKSLNPGAINQFIKTLGTACKFDFVPELSSHSFRRGLSTSAAREKVDFELIKKQGGWKNDDIVRGYIEEGQQFTSNATLVLMKKMTKMLQEADIN